MIADTFPPTIVSCEGRYRALFHALADGVVFQDATGAVVDANPAAEVILGLTREQLLGRSSLDPRWRTVHADGSPCPGEAHPSMRALASGREIGPEVLGVYNPETDDYRWLMVRAQPLFRPDEERPFEVCVVFADIAHIKEDEERLQAVVNQSPHGIVEADPLTQRLLWCNPAMLRLFGYAEDEFATLSALDLHPPEAHDRIRAEFARIVAGDLTASADLPCRHRDGNLFYCKIAPGLLRLGAAPRLIAFFADTTTEYRLRQALAHNEQALLRAQTIAQLGSWELDLRTDELTWSPEVFRIFELDPLHFGASYAAFMARVHPDDRALVDRAFREALLQRASYEVTHRLALPDGRIKWVHERGESDYDERGRALRARGTVQDITRIKEIELALRESETRYRHLVANIPGAIFRYVLEPDGREAVYDMNPNGAAIWGVAPEDIARDPSILWKTIDAEDVAAMRASILESIRHLTPWSHAWRIVTPQGERRWLQGAARPSRRADGGTQMDALVLDVTERHLAEAARRESEQREEFLLYYDALTRLPNRMLLRDRLDHAVARARRDGTELALLLIDLDRFKNINETLGHGVGDALLRAVAERMGDRLRASDTLARLGGDEFAILLEQDCNAQAASDILARALLEQLAEPLRVDIHWLYVSASIGIALFPAKDTKNADDLLRHADVALYKAKHRGRNTCEYFDQEMAQHTAERLRLENALRGALAQHQFLVYYQPQVRLDDGTLAGVEALVRWRHPEFGMVSPAEFIPMAEEIGLVGEIGAWVLRESCRQLRAWDAAGLRVPSVSVNLSVQQLERQALIEQVTAALAENKLSPERLELEITESMIMREPERAIKILQALRQLGTAISVDDFGTGYSSLAYIKRLPLNRLKIDRSFVSDIGSDRDDETISCAIIGLCASLKLEAVAEGIETEEQARFLLSKGCPLGQGYLYSRPLPADELLAWARSRGVAATR